MLNKYIAIGNLTVDPSTKQIKDNSLTTFSLAVNNPVNKNDVCFIDVETWNRTADNCAKFLKKGSRIFLEGRLKYSCWEAKDGSKKCKVSCVADYVQFMSTKNEEDSAPQSEPKQKEEEFTAEEIDELTDVPF